MVKLVFCLRRKDGMELGEFQRYWREEHAPLVQQHAAALGIVRYVQTHTRPSPEADLLRASRGGPEAYDGVAELWFGDTAALIEAASTPEGQAAGAALLEDEKRFIDLARSPLFLADEHEVLGPAGGGAPLGADTAWDEP
jgi:uncharacterized protein (TIGR02118 family)